MQHFLFWHVGKQLSTAHAHVWGESACLLLPQQQLHLDAAEAGWEALMPFLIVRLSWLILVVTLRPDQGQTCG